MNETKAKRIFVGTELILIAVLLATCVRTSAAESNDGARRINMGEDDTAPLRRFDVRQDLKQIDGDSDSYTTTLRIDLPMLLDQGRSGIFYYRMDMPFTASDAPGDDNPNGDTYKFGAGDFLTQFIYVLPLEVSEDLPWDSIGFGARFIWPTASKSTLGAEKYQVAPLIATKWKTPQISKGSWVAPTFRYFLSYDDYGSAGERRDDISELAIHPQVYIKTREWGWPIDFMHFWSTRGIHINFEGTNAKDSGDMFVPFDIMLGKMLNENTVASVEFTTPIVNDYDLYDWIVEFRIGFFF